MAVMESPTFWDNPEKARKTIQQLKQMNAVLKPYEELFKGSQELTTLKELSQEDESLLEEYQQEVDRLSTILEDFELKSLMSGSQDMNDALVQIKPGAGGTDACDWAEIMLRMYSRWAQRHGFGVEIQDQIDNGEGGLQSVLFKVSGNYAYGYLQGEIGVHRLVRISPFGGGDTRHTSFAAVDVIAEIDDDIDIEIKESDLEMQTFCSGGPGGQHQNKTQSGVRLIHKPTNIRAESRTERSQNKNYENALKLLKSRLYAVEEQKRMGDIEKRYDAKGEVAFGSQIRSYIMQPYTLVRDEREGIEIKTPDVKEVLDGNLDEFMNAHLRYRTQKRMNRKESA